MTTWMPYRLIIFDLDGVITTEHIYWECTRLTLWELLHLRWRVVRPYVQAVHDGAARESILAESLVYAFKNRAINSNWDLTFLGACAILGALPEGIGHGANSVESLLSAVRYAQITPVRWPQAVEHFLVASGEVTGSDLLEFAGQWAAGHLRVEESVLHPEGPWWEYLYQRFQMWFDGSLMGAWGAGPLQELPVVSVKQLRAALAALRDTDCLLAVATGRPREEAVPALESFGVLDLFEIERLATFTDVLAAQEITGLKSLGKPHPFTIRRAMHPELSAGELVNGSGDDKVGGVLVVGDSVSDALAATAAGVDCLGVLSGVRGEQARQKRREALLTGGCIDVVDDVTDVPVWVTAR
jgi:phosphoglycolate phosphatase-like HAD superfamily hydrolase